MSSKFDLNKLLTMIKFGPADYKLIGGGLLIFIGVAMIIIFTFESNHQATTAPKSVSVTKSPSKTATAAASASPKAAATTPSRKARSKSPAKAPPSEKKTKGKCCSLRFTNSSLTKPRSICYLINRS